MVNNQQVNRSSPASNGVLVGALVVAAYLAGAVDPRGRPSAPGARRAWWPAAGIGVVAVLRTPRRHWPTVFGLLLLAFALANLTAGRSVLVSSLLGLADVAETIIVATLIRRYVGRHIEDVADVWRLFAIATAGALVAATGIALVYEQLLGSAFWPVLGLDHGRARRFGDAAGSGCPAQARDSWVVHPATPSSRRRCACSWPRRWSPSARHR